MKDCSPSSHAVWKSKVWCLYWTTTNLSIVLQTITGNLMRVLRTVFRRFQGCLSMRKLSTGRLPCRGNLSIVKVASQYLRIACMTIFPLPVIIMFSTVFQRLQSCISMKIPSTGFITLVLWKIYWIIFTPTKWLKASRCLCSFSKRVGYQQNGIILSMHRITCMSPFPPI